MPEEQGIERAKRDKEQGKSASTQAGEFVREEMHHIREGKHGAQSPQQAIAIGLSKARRAGVDLPAPKRGTVSSKTRAQAMRDSRKGKQSPKRKPSRVRSRAISNALKREGHSAASRSSLSKQTRTVARKRGRRSRHESAIKAAHTKGKRGLRRAAHKAAVKRMRSA
jgi:Family of unknown function (DUF6496)